jgi:predicted transcriptional regulator
VLRRSKLEIYIDVLSVLSQRGPLKLTHIMHKANVNCNVLRDGLAFLLKQKLIEKRNCGRNKILFEISLQGVTVLKYFKQLDKALPTLIENKPCF